jgi:hypothetical protein
MKKLNRYNVIHSSRTSALYIEKIVEAYSEAGAINIMLDEYPFTELNAWSAWFIPLEHKRFKKGI